MEAARSTVGEAVSTEPEGPQRATPRQAIPHTREFLADTLTPVNAYDRLRSLGPYHFLFESITGGEQVSRYSFLGASPSIVLDVHFDRIERTCTATGTTEVRTDDPLVALRSELESVTSSDHEVPFTGGWVAQVGYDIVRLIERLPDRPPDPFDLPVARFLRFDSLLVFDHAFQRLIAISNEIEGEVTREQAEARLEELGELVTSASAGRGRPLERVRSLKPTAKPPTLSDDEYEEAVRQAKEYIAAGDIFQVVLARRWEVDSVADPLTLYRALRWVNPSPYMVLLESPDAAIVGASPEMLVRKTRGVLQVRPIAGTRNRVGDAAEDQRLGEELLEDPKERAEHVMLVDLGRNDLGRVAVPGGVQVKDFMELEYYSHVIHLVSSVEAEQRPDGHALDALLATFPAGTLSGAPKIRAMEIIDELEPEARGAYGGAVGYFSYNGDMDTCITIRTLVMTPEHTSVTAGAGIVADSDPTKEARESEAKAAAVLAAVEVARRLEEDES